jgi:hypothetical protein
MFSIKEEDLQNLISKHNNKNKRGDRIPIYDLKTIVEYGLAFIYAKSHLEGSVVQDCQEEFNIYKKHKCSKKKAITKSYRSNFIEVSQITMLDKTEYTLKSCWTGYNLAILTASFNLQGYFGKDLLFQKKIPEACSLIATSDQIYLGSFDGSIVSFDPISQNTMVEQRHNDVITSLCIENDILLSSSMDGSIYYNHRIPINESGVLNCKLIGDEKFFCSCTDNSLVLADNGNIRTFIGHKDNIKSISYNKFGISSSREGTVGYLLDEQIFETESLGLSHHHRLNTTQFIGYGLDKVVFYDTNLKTEVWSVPENSLSLDVKENLMAYSFNKNIKLRDIRSKDSLNIILNANITDLKFSESNDMLLVCTDQSPFLLELKYI